MSEYGETRVLTAKVSRTRSEGTGTYAMLRNFWTVLAVFACIFTLASLSTAAKARRTGTNPQSPTAPDRAPEVPGDGLLAAHRRADPISTAPNASRAVPLETGAEDEQVEVPQTDSLPPDPPQGVLFSGRGKFQLYRQGDITWRLDTETGAVCVLLASEEQWRKWEVLHQACSRP